MRFAECHPDRRYVAKGRCRECYQKDYLSNHEKRKIKNEYYMSFEWRSYRAQYYKSPPQRQKQREKREINKGIRDPSPKRQNFYAPAEIEEIREKENDKKFRNTPEGATKIRVRRRKWASSPKGKACISARSAAYRAAKKERTVSWADKDKLHAIYLNKPKGMAVDHILPLQGEKISGLHVPENLQYLTREENSTKSNSFDFTEENEGWRIKLTYQPYSSIIGSVDLKKEDNNEQE